MSSPLLTVIDVGPRDAAVVVLLHGFPLSSAMWREQIAALSDRWRVLAPDLRGFGASRFAEGAVAEGGDDSLDQYADDVVAALDALGISEPTTVCGFSMGGYVALNLLRRHPERIGALVLMGTLATADGDAQRATRLKMAEGVHEWGSARVAELMRPKLFGPAAPQRAIDETAAVIAATDPRAIAAAQRAMAARPDSTGLLPSIVIPTLLVAGVDDAISTVEAMRSMAAAIPGSRFEVIDGAGHMTPVEQPQAVSDVLRDFLRASNDQ
ncbi:MAG: alpha/beta fold hydrolase [Lacipirellulaceae bacterium]